MEKRPFAASIDPTELKAVAFDLDGTLYPEYRMVVPTLALAFRHPRLLYAFSRVRREIRTISEDDDFRKRQAALMAKRLGVDLDKAAHLTERIIYGQWLDSLKGLRTFPGLRDVILKLRKAGFKTALVSDMPIKKKIVFLGLEDVWDCAYTSEETGALKPDPRVFKPMLDALRLAPRQILYIGNNYEYDVLGAGQLGMATGFISSRRIRDNRADFIFKYYPQMRRFLLTLAGGRGA